LLVLLQHYHVYVLELSKAVLREGHFKKHNPAYLPGKPRGYGAMVRLDPHLRFAKHKASLQSNRYVENTLLARCLLGFGNCG
jgi:hypothetical protein